MKVTKHYSHFGKRTNEDGYIFTDDYVVFLDGATGLSKRLVDPVSDAKWYVDQFLSIFSTLFDIKTDPQLIIRDTIRQIKERYIKIVGDIELKSYMLPSATGTIVVFDEVETKMYYFGDIRTLVHFNNGDTKKIADRKLTNLDNKIFRTARENAKINKTFFKTELGKLKKQIRSNRSLMNAKNGYFIFSLDEDIIDEINITPIPTSEIKEILLMTDGFYGYYQTWSYKRIIAQVNKYDPKDHVMKIKRYYTEDKDFEKRERFKLVDDISFMLIEN